MGAAIAKRFQAEGAAVVATGANPETLAKARKQLSGIEFVASDASDIESIRALVEKLVRDHGRIDILAVNAGTAGYVPVGKVEPHFFDRIFDLNAKGAYFLMQEVVSVMPAGDPSSSRRRSLTRWRCQTTRYTQQARRRSDPWGGHSRANLRVVAFG